MSADIRTDVAHPARVYDYWLGGKDNFAADRAAAEQVMQAMPEILDTVRGNRQFMVRAVRFLRDAGIRQFLDIGSGLPSRPNVHEIAQAEDAGARVVYVDHDPVVYSHAGAMTAKSDGTSVVWADLRDTEKVMSGAAGLLDFTQPVGLLFVGCLHHIPDSDDPAGVVAQYLAALAPGSYLVISHATDEFSPEKMQANADVADSSGTMLIPRSKDAILRMFNGRELVDPGLVLVSRWRPDGDRPDPNADRAWVYGGVATLA
ncbi:MAG: SAM-dependent methyltransferase [Actinomycetota bacterium]|nr:SAM-dependent methyltransferase [Actinomycetota bacterium]